MRWTDEEIDRRMGGLLRWGVLTAAGVMLIGGILYLSSNFNERPDYSQFHSVAEPLRRIPRIVREALHGNAPAVIQVGTLLMIATPVARVAFAAYAFLRSHDRTYVAVSCIVLALLAYGIFFGS